MYLRSVMYMCVFNGKTAQKWNRFPSAFQSKDPRSPCKWNLSAIYLEQVSQLVVLCGSTTKYTLYIILLLKANPNSRSSWSKCASLRRSAVQKVCSVEKISVPSGALDCNLQNCQAGCAIALWIVKPKAFFLLGKEGGNRQVCCSNISARTSSYRLMGEHHLCVG